VEIINIQHSFCDLSRNVVNNEFWVPDILLFTAIDLAGYTQGFATHFVVGLFVRTSGMHGIHGRPPDYVT